MPIKTTAVRALERLLDDTQRRSTAVLIATAAMAIAAVVLVLRVSFDPNVLRLLPRDAPAVQSFETFLVNFGSLDHLYVVFESPDPIGTHADAIDSYVEALRKAPEIESVDAALFEEGKDWTYLYDRELFLLGPAGAAEGLSRLRPPAIDRELAHARDLLQMPSSDIKTMVQQDPLGLLTLVRNQFARQKGFVAFDPTQTGYVSADGRSRLVIVKPRGAPFDTDFCKALFRRLDEIDRTLRASADDVPGAAGMTMQAAGAYRVSLAAESLIRRETIVNSVGSLVLLLIIVMAVFRTPWMMIYGTVPLAIAAVMSLGLAGLALGRLSPATSGSSAMLFGLGIDGVVLLYMRYLEGREAGAEPASAIRGMSGTAVSVILAQVTTAATFFALLFIDFPTLNDLGALVGIGILLTCVLTLVLLPALLTRNARTHGRLLTAPWLGDFVERHSRAILVAGAAATLLLGASATRLRLDMRLERLQVKPAGPDLERDVASRFSLPSDVLLVVNEGAGVDPLVTLDARVAAAFESRMPPVAVSGISLMMPPAESQAMVADEIRRAGSIDEISNRIRAAALRAGFRPEAFQPFIDRLPRLLDPDARITHDGLLAHGLDPVVSRFIAHRGERYSAVTYLYPPAGTDLSDVETILSSVDPRLQLSGLPAIDRDLRRRFPAEFAKGVLLGGAAVTVLIYAAFRAVRYTLLALLPVVAGFVWSAGILGLAHVELDLFSMFAAVTCIGIAVDYGIYVLGRYTGHESESVRTVLSRTGAAIIVACGTALVGFGTLINSTYAPLRVFGLVSVVTLLSCLVAALFLLPAILLHTRR